MKTKLLTVFTPAYNRADLLTRGYEALNRQSSRNFEWLIVDDGSTDGTRQLVRSWLGKPDMETEETFEGMTAAGYRLRYIHKENGGLYTGYNTAYANARTELCVCIDSDDYMPDDAVEKIETFWREHGSNEVAGIIGLDFDLQGNPLGGYFPEDLKQCWFIDLYNKNIHRADTKEVMRTALMREVAPQVGFEGEKNFNPVYMLMQVCDRYPMLLLNENLCCVDYQPDGMAANIFKQYINSPRSFAKLRQLEMQLVHNTWRNRFRSAIHYVSSCALSHNGRWLKDSPRKGLTLLAAPLGWALSRYIKHRAK